MTRVLRSRERLDTFRALVRVGFEHAFERADQRGVDHEPFERCPDVDREPPMRQLLGLDPGEHHERRRRDRVDVGLRHRAALELLGRHVAERADDGAAAFGLHPIADGAEVDERERAVFPAKDVARLDVSVDDRRRASVEVFERTRRFGEEAADVALAEPCAALLHGREALAVDVFRDEEELAAFFEVLDVLRQALVIEAREHLRFALGELDFFPALRASNAEAFHDDGAADLLVDRVIARRLSAFAEKTDHGIAASAEGDVGRLVGHAGIMRANRGECTLGGRYGAR